MKNHMPLISIIMPVYNGERFVEQAIESIVHQTYTRIELIICDDGSTDKTWGIIQACKRRYPTIIKSYRFNKNLGESTAANFAFTKTRGAYIARFDADDIAHPQRIEKQIAYLSKHKQVVALGTQATVIDVTGRVIGHKHTPLTHTAIYQSFAYINPMVHPSVMFRRSLLPKRTYLYQSAFESTDDYHTYFELLNYGSFANLNEELVSYRIHDTNKSLSNMKEKFWTDTKVRINAVITFHYKAPIFMIPAILLQAFMVFCIPESLLRELFYYIRGIKKVSLNINIPLQAMEKLKTYAATFLA